MSEARPETVHSTDDRSPASAGAIAVTETPAAIWPVVACVAVGVVVAVGLGVYGRVHQPQGYSINVAGFPSALSAKAWLATVVLALVVVQLLSALSMYGRLGRSPAWVSGVHRWSGRLAVLVSVPVAVNCLYALGFQPTTGRVLVHSLLGCVFYGAFVTKMLLLSRRGVPGWAVPVIGGLLFAVLVAVWLTSALWFFTAATPSY